MGKPTSKQWSAALRQATRDTLEELPFLPDGVVRMKHVDGRFGSMDMVRILAGKFEITPADEREPLSFFNIDAVIDAGWAID